MGGVCAVVSACPKVPLGTRATSGALLRVAVCGQPPRAAWRSSPGLREGSEGENGPVGVRVKTSEIVPRGEWRSSDSSAAASVAVVPV